MESSYIYWQAMNGDMILTITNEKIEIDGKDQPNLQCLICYVAEKPSSKTDTYFEAYSYLTVGNPYQHSNNVDSATFKAKSNCFYRGCNTDDFFTFCLKINYKTGEVSLTHAGPNGIYNHENIYYQFKKSEVDLLGLNYIHISAGKQDVPIRNLTINHEPIDKLHPTFDRDFKLDTLNLIRARRASFQYTGGTTDRGGDKDVHSSDASPKPIKKAASTVDLHVKLVDPPATPGKTTKPKKRGFFERLKYIFMGTTKGGDPPESKPPPSSSSNLFKDDESKSDSSSYNPSKFDSPSPKSSKVHSSGSKPVAASSVPLISSALPLCADSIYCLIQNERDHTDKYSHFCRFNELCRNQAGEPHLVHKKHNVPKCLEDKSCSERTNPVHRAEYRHSGLPDYLIPCHFQDTCYDKTPDHRLRFFHGEEIPRIRKSNTPKSHHVGAALKAKLPPCRHGNECRSMKNTQHTARFSHPTS
ncbi:unnamed protein product [Rotaria socialis]